MRLGVNLDRVCGALCEHLYKYIICKQANIHTNNLSRNITFNRPMTRDHTGAVPDPGYLIRNKIKKKEEKKKGEHKHERYVKIKTVINYLYTCTQDEYIHT